MRPSLDTISTTLSGTSSSSIGSSTSTNSIPDLLYAVDNRSFTSLLASLKQSSEQETWLLDVILKRSVNMYKANATDEKKMVSKSSNILSRLEGGNNNGGDGVIVSQSIQACKAVQQNITESASDHLALETFLRDTTYRNLSANAKSRESRLKERVKSVQSMLSKLEHVEKAFIRALTDLKDEERKHSYLLSRKELDISEEIEKVEIDLRKCTSQLAVKQGEFDIVKYRLLEVQDLWKKEWHGFRIYTRVLELERKADHRNVLIELSRASMLIKYAEIARQESLIHQLESQDLLFEINLNRHFAISSLGGMDVATIPEPLRMESIRGKIWPNSGGIEPLTPSASGRGGKGILPHPLTGRRPPPLDANQLASISRPGRPTPLYNIGKLDNPTSAHSNGFKSAPPLLTSSSSAYAGGAPALTTSFSASSAASSSSSSSASTPKSADFPVPPGSGRKSFDSPSMAHPAHGVTANAGRVGMMSDREYGEEMFSVPRKAVTTDPIVLDRYGRAVTSPARMAAETPTKPSLYSKSPHRVVGGVGSPLEAFKLSSPYSTHTSTAFPTKSADDSSTPTAIKASLTSSVGPVGQGSTGRKASKPLPGLPAGKKDLGLGDVNGQNEEDLTNNGQSDVDLQDEDEEVPSLPSFSNLKLSEMRMSGMWFAQT